MKIKLVQETTKMNEKLRLATNDDKDAVIEVLNYYVANSTAAYPMTFLGDEAWNQLRFMARENNIWVMENAEGDFLGFAMLKWFMARDSFNHTAELSYFIKADQTGKGLGRRLLEKLEDQARALGVKILVANVSSLNQESLAFHQKMGFQECGRIPGVAKKFDETFDVVWFYKNL